MANRHRGKSFGSLARRAPTRKAAERVLIVCEGSRTEPTYLRDMVSDLELTNADVQVCGEECGSDPYSIARYAVERAKAEEGVDHVYCVFDRDSHTTKSKAVALLEKSGKRPPPTYTVVESIPCFEYWLLLHFEETAKPYAAEGKKSICDACIADVKKHPVLANYVKGTAGLYSILKDRLPDALVRARRRSIQAVKEGTDMPTTSLPQLVDKLHALSPRLKREAEQSAKAEAETKGR